MYRIGSKKRYQGTVWFVFKLQPYVRQTIDTVSWLEFDYRTGGTGSVKNRFIPYFLILSHNILVGIVIISVRWQSTVNCGDH